MNLTQTKPAAPAVTTTSPAVIPATKTIATNQIQTQFQPKIWKEATAEVGVGDVIRKPYCPIARVVGKETLKDGRVCLIVVFPGWGDRHTEEWVIPTAPAATTAAPATVAKPESVEPTATVATKKLMLSLVSVKRITSDIPASNFDRNELEIAGELSLAIGGFCTPPVLRREGDGYKVVSGHFQYHAAVLARRLNPKAGENIPALVLEAENQSAVLAQLGILKLRAA
jgi:hypothetical protein